jgi:hypothetical protein
MFSSFKIKIIFENFTFSINSNPIYVNYSLFCCVSDILFYVDSSKQSLSFSVSDDVLKCFCSFIKVFDGIPFQWKNFHFSTLNSMIETFHLKSLRNFINQFLSLPKNVEDAIQLLSGSALFLSEDIFLQSFSILVDNFYSLNANQLDSLSIEVLKQLFSSDKLNNLDDEILFNLIFKLIKKIKKRKFC